MERSMVNGAERNGNTKASCMQANVLHKISTSPLTASIATQSKNDLMETTDTRQFHGTHADEPTPSQTKFADHKAEKKDRVLSYNLSKLEATDTKKTLFCSFPLERVQTILSKYTSSRPDGSTMKVSRKVLCLYCDRTFVNVNLRQKHVERCHSSKQLRRVSLRKNQNFLTNTPCIYCDKFTSTEHTLKDLFQHLIDNHSSKYFGCFSCETRFLNSFHLTDHNVVYHEMKTVTEEPISNDDDLSILFHSPSNLVEKKKLQEMSLKVPRKKQKTNKGNKTFVVDTTNIQSIVEESTTSTNMKNLRSKKLSVKSSRMILKRSKRLQAKVSDPCRKKKTRDFNEKKKNVRPESILNSKLNEKCKTTAKFVNPYPDFDRFYQPRQITDHSIDNLKISSLTFDDVFDKAFFSRIKCNIQENLLHHIDGKLFKNEESESRISNFEKNSNIVQETQSVNLENFGCELSLNAVAPTTLVLSNPLGDDPESQIEYGSKPSKKKTQMKKDEIHYKYFTRRKYQASILEHKENRDLSKLDMWTQYIIKNRQQKILDDKRSPKEILDYFASEEYKNTIKRDELNRILDRRGPFEDLREEASKKAALDKLNGENICTDDGHLTEVGELLNDILDRVFELATESSSLPSLTKNVIHPEEHNVPEIPSYLNLRPNLGLTCENEIDKSDKISLICSSQETENFELPSNTVRGKNEKVELTGEWARSRIYVCAACGIKLQNIKQFLEHKSASHQYIWVQHYEFVGNQSELYRHLSIPVLGKVGVLENIVQCKVWKRSDSRLCTKCGKQCNSLGELHRHILECGGDWTWMLARKKCKYRPFGAKSRRKRRGLVKRIYPQKSEPTEKKIYKIDIPRQKPSDADSIKRMLANLPPKRATRKVISLKDGFNTTRSKRVKNTNQSKFKCGKLIHGKTKEQNTTEKTDYQKTKKNQNTNHRRSLRSLNKILTNRLLDTNSSLMARRKYTRKNERKKIRNAADESDNNITREMHQEVMTKVPLRKNTKQNNYVKIQNVKDVKVDCSSKRSSPRIGKRLEFNADTDKMNIKRFFPVKKKTIFDNVTIVDGNKFNLPGKSKEIRKLPQKYRLDENSETCIDEIKNGQLSSIANLRKRKNEGNSVESGITKKAKMRKSSITKTRKLKTSSRNIGGFNGSETNLNETVNTGNSENFIQSDSNVFFEKLASEGSIDSSSGMTVGSGSEEHQNILCDIEAEKQSEIDGLDSEKNLLANPENENSTFFVSQPPKPKQIQRKVKKQTRGLNDCIAMLTNKLSKDCEKQTDIFKDEICLQSNSEHVIGALKEKPECILKVPFSNEHFHLGTSNSECLGFTNNLLTNTDGALAVSDEKIVPNEITSQCDLSVALRSLAKLPDRVEETDKQTCKQGSIKTLEHSKRQCCISEGLKYGLCNGSNTSVTELEQYEYNKIEEAMVEICEKSANTVLKRNEFISVVKVTDDVTEREIISEIQSICKKDNNSTDSEDDVPLLTLLREEQSDKDLPLKNKGSETTFVNHTEIFIDDKMSFHLHNEGDKRVKTGVKSNHLEINNGCQSDKIVFNGSQPNEKCNILDELMKKQDAPMLINADDIFESASVNSLHINMSENNRGKTNFIDNKFLECKVDSNLIQVGLDAYDKIVLTNITTDTKENDHVVSLEQHSINVLSKLDEFSIFPEDCENTDIDKDTVNDVSEEPIHFLDLNVDKNNKSEIDSSEYKKNSKLLGDHSLGKHKKERKKTPVSNKIFNKNKKSEAQIRENSKENTDSQNVNSNKNAIRNVKTKTLESIFDDALLELSENELVPQDNLKNSVEDVVIEHVLKQNPKSDTNIPEEILLEKNIPCKSGDIVFNNSPLDTKILLENNEKAIVNNKYGNELNEQSVRNNLVQGCSQKTTLDDVNGDGTNVKELRRSSRNSKRVTCYNETDLVDSLFDDLDSDRTISKIIKETTKDIFGVKRKNRKLFTRKATKNGQTERKLCGDELFDLLKTTPNENIVLSTPSTTFFNTFNEISTDFNDDNFDVFEDILEKSMAVIEENLSQEVISPIQKVINSYNKNVDSNSKTHYISEETRKKSLQKKSAKSKNKSKNRILQKHVQNKLVSFEKTHSSIRQTLNDHSELDCTSNLHVLSNNDLNLNELNRCDFTKDSIYCEICDKSFCRIESLTKHKRTLTHISKLSELEAKETALKTKDDQKSTNGESEITNATSNSRKNMNLFEMLKTIDDERCKPFSSPFSVKIDNSNLKLADIINDVLNKPILKEDGNSDFTEVAAHSKNDVHSEMRRYKSLGERKSFESENHLLVTKKDAHVNNIDYFESEISSAAAGTILEKQITLLENIIENRSGLSYIDELSVSSTQSINDNSTNTICSNQINSVQPCSNQFGKENIVKSNLEDNFLRPLQYEEISDDSNLKNYDEQKSRKALNRDEELFLECCSLLKSGSEVSSYSKKSNNLSKDVNNLELKPCGNPDWIENTCLSHKKNNNFVQCYSDNARIRTPLGDSFSQEDSNSVTISSQWGTNNSCTLLKEENLNLQSNDLNFEEVFNKNEDIFRKENKEKLQTLVSPFDLVIADVFTTELDSSAENLKNGNVTNLEDTSFSNGNRELKESFVVDGKKVLTKGAMKVFEGIKVSIPTEELNIDKILILGSPTKKTNFSDSDLNECTLEGDSTKGQKSAKCKSQLRRRSYAKTKPKHVSRALNRRKQNNLQINCKVNDVYDFEETQDNSDVFTRPDFRSFRNKHDKTRKFEKVEDSDDDSQDCTDTVSFDAFSSGTSTVSEVLSRKSSTQQNITKKKCMIMGRIFKNALKSKVTDEDIRNIPIIDNTKLVEDFVLSCPEPAISVKKKPRMSEEEMNLAFDKLINSKASKSKQTVTKVDSLSQHSKNCLTKRKQKTCKKKNYGYSQSSDDEFKLQRYSRRRPRKKSSNAEDSCINLEQELRECIGVASRKSQRKCTSGKQNVLIEYWSSDESLFEAEDIVIDIISKNCSDNDESIHDVIPDESSKKVETSSCNITAHDNVLETFSGECFPKTPTYTVNRRKRVAANPLYHWSSSSEDESHDLIEIRPVRDEIDDDGDRPVQHGWIVGDSPKKLVTMLAHAKGKKCDADGVKEHGKKRTNTYS